MKPTGATKDFWPDLRFPPINLWAVAARGTVKQLAEAGYFKRLDEDLLTDKVPRQSPTENIS